VYPPRNIPHVRAHWQIVAIEFGEIEPARLERIVTYDGCAAQLFARHCDQHVVLVQAALSA